MRVFIEVGNDSVYLDEIEKVSIGTTGLYIKVRGSTAEYAEHDKDRIRFLTELLVNASRDRENYRVAVPKKVPLWTEVEGMEMSRAIDIGYQFADKYESDSNECIDGIVYCPSVTFAEVARAFKVLIGAQIK